jgi:predicted ATP-dependent endonuclease of OLD family
MRTNNKKLYLLSIIMLKSLQLENYRCFDDHQITFKKTAIIVGKNNAGKSTIIEALRLVSIVATRALNYQDPPNWLDINKTSKGVSPSLTGLGFSVKNIFHNYRSAPAKITAIFKNGIKIEIFIGEEAEVFALMYDSEGQIIKSKTAKRAEVPEINILPQISALAREEKVLGADYVKANLSTHLSSLHFRNQVKYFNKDFALFKDFAESSWPGLGIQDLDGRSLFKGSALSLIVRDGQFAAEIGWMGHGLQMWLQTMWFLSRSDKSSTVILDEPDVYMHADLQRKLIRLLKSNYNQVFVATHSIEIISEVEPENILVVDKSSKRSTYTTSFPAVQNIVSGIGSMQNIGLARIWSAKKLLLVEGKDVGILKRLQETIFGSMVDSFEIIPRSDIGGWSGWNNVKGADFVLKNGLKQNIKVFCILDSDYYLEAEKQSRRAEAKERQISLHIWTKKEIENYLLQPAAIFRAATKIGTSKSLTLEQIAGKLEMIADEMRDDVVGNYANEIQRADKKIQAGDAYKQAAVMIKEKWNAEKLNLVSGKELIKRLNNWLMSEYKVSIGIHHLAKEIRQDEMDAELIKVVSCIEKNEPFE